MAAEVVARLLEVLRLLLRRQGRAAVVPGERRRDDLVARDELGEDRPPVAPVAHEPVQQDDGLARAGAIEVGCDHRLECYPRRERRGTRGSGYGAAMQT